MLAQESRIRYFNWLLFLFFLLQLSTSKVYKADAESRRRRRENYMTTGYQQQVLGAKKCLWHIQDRKPKTGQGAMMDRTKRDLLSSLPLKEIREHILQHFCIIYWEHRRTEDCLRNPPFSTAVCRSEEYGLVREEIKQQPPPCVQGR